MATITATKSGNWSDITVWDLARVPADGDDVALAGYDIVWDTGVTRIPATGTLTSITSTGTDGQITLALDNAAFHDGAELYCTTIQAGTKPATSGILLVTGDTDHVLTITCGTTAGTGIIGGSGGNGAWGIYLKTSGTVNIIGRVTGGVYNDTYGVYIDTLTPTITVSAGLFGGTATNARGLQNNFANTDITIAGGCTGGSGALAFGLSNGYNITIAISGDITGGSGNGACGCYTYGSLTQITLSSSTKLINGTGGVAYTMIPPAWQPTAATCMHWYLGALFRQAPNTEFVQNLAAEQIKKGVTSGSVTGTLAGGGFVGRSALVG